MPTDGPDARCKGKEDLSPVDLNTRSAGWCWEGKHDWGCPNKKGEIRCIEGLQCPKDRSGGGGVAVSSSTIDLMDMCDLSKPEELCNLWINMLDIPCADKNGRDTQWDDHCENDHPDQTILFSGVIREFVFQGDSAFAIASISDKYNLSFRFGTDSSTSQTVIQPGDPISLVLNRSDVIIIPKSES